MQLGGDAVRCLDEAAPEIVGPIGVGEAVRRTVDMDRSDGQTVGTDDRGSQRVDAVDTLLEAPRVSELADRVEALADGVGVDQGVGRELFGGLGEIGLCLLYTSDAADE